jgi:hypothetical protein
MVDAALFYGGLGFVVVVQVLCLIGLMWGLIELRAMQKATHSVQFVPVDQTFQKVTEEVKETLSKDPFDNLQ